MSVESKSAAGAQSVVSSVAGALLRHYDAHARTLPWRVSPGANGPADPYRVWMSEIMLQQTTVAAVIPYFDAFTRRWPDVVALAKAEDADVMAAWAGLGYYARARNLLACARKVAFELDGIFPNDEKGLLELPGIGPYTAAAIAAIAFGQYAVVVDANVERVVSRLFAIETPLPKGKEDIRAATARITPDARAGDFAQAMMDLGAGICSVRAPSCLLCPLASHCQARAAGNPEDYPRKAPKKERPHRTGMVWWLERDDGHVWLERRGDKRMLGGMRGFPGSLWDKRGGGEVDPPACAGWRDLPGTVEHVFTHFSLSLSVSHGQVESGCTPAGEGEWWRIDEIGAAGLPTLFAKVVRHVSEKMKK